jgi:UDP-glucose 4-epimerase
VLGTTQPYRGKRIVVTGGGGYLGTNLIRALSQTPCDIVRLVRSAPKPLDVLDAQARIHDVVGDVTDANVWPALLGEADVVFHLAAQTSVAVARRDPLADMAQNVVPVLALLESCRNAASPPFVVFAGTATEVGVTTQVPVNETFTDNPVTIYDLHKLMAERYLAWYAMGGLVRGATLRLANVFGPGPTSSSADRGVLNHMIRKAIRGEQLTVYGSGSQVRDFTFVDDVVDAFLMAGAHPSETSGQYFVVGTGVGHTIRQAAELVADVAAERTGKRVEVMSVVPPPTESLVDERHFVADTSRFRAATGWQPRWTLRRGLERAVESVLADTAA